MYSKLTESVEEEKTEALEAIPQLSPTLEATAYSGSHAHCHCISHLHPSPVCRHKDSLVAKRLDTRDFHSTHLHPACEVVRDLGISSRPDTDRLCVGLSGETNSFRLCESLNLCALSLGFGSGNDAISLGISLRLKDVLVMKNLKKYVGTDIAALGLDASNSESPFFLFNFIRVFSVDILQHVSEGSIYIIGDKTHRSLDLRL
jgi:hypothetical protein